MATFKLELTGEEGSAVQQMVNASKISATAARIVASIQDKLDAAVEAFNEATKAEQNSSPPDTPKTESPRLDGEEGGEVSS